MSEDQTPDLGMQPPPNREGLESVHFNEIKQILRLRRKYIIFVILLTLGGSLLGHMLYLPTYTAKSSVSLKIDRGNGVADLLLSARSGELTDNEQVQKFMHFIQTDSFYLSVAQALKFHKSYNRLKLESAKSVSFFSLNFWKKSIVRIFKDEKKENPKKKREKKSFIPVEQVAGFLKGNTVVETDYKQTIKIKATTMDAFTSMVIVNLVATEFVKIANERNGQEIKEVEDFIRAKLEESTKRLKMTELKYVEFKKNNNIVSLQSSSGIYYDQLRKLEGKLAEAKLQLEGNRKLLKFLEKTRSQSIHSLDTVGTHQNESNSEMIKTLSEQLNRLKRQKSLMLSQGMNEFHWRVVEVDREIKKIAQGLKTQLAQGGTQTLDFEITESDKKISGIKEKNKVLIGRIETLAKARREIMKKFENVPGTEQELMSLKRKLELEYDLFSNLKKKLNQIEIQRISVQRKVRIDKLSSLPAASKRGNLLLKIIFSIAVGLFLGGLFAFGFEYLDSTVKHRSDIESCAISYLGDIPHLDNFEVHTKLGFKKFNADMLVCEEKPDSFESMSFKFIRARIESLQSRDHRKINSITITSPQDNDGKSFVCCNLGISLAQLGKKVLIIDSDLRSPSIHAYFSLPDSDGLSDLLEMRTNLEDVIVESTIPNLSILPAGYPYSQHTELLSGKRFKILLDFLKEQYDYILVDTPPANAFVDAAVVCALTDTAILVSNYRKTTKHDLLTAHRQIVQIRHRKIHGVLNNVQGMEPVLSYYPYTYKQNLGRKESFSESINQNEDERNREFEDSLKVKKG